MRSRWALVAVVIGLVAARIAAAMALWRPGWSALSGDDFYRTALAQQWAFQPFLVTPDMVWLPLQSWVDGLAFRVSGRMFDDDPMLLVALVNSMAALGTAALVGCSAGRLFGSTPGGLTAFAIVLFAPYAVFTSLSGLSEPLYYLALALAVFGFVNWVAGRRKWALALGSYGVAASCLIRYEGWVLAASWVVVVAFTVADPHQFSLTALLRSWWRHRAEMTLSLAPLLVPVLTLGIYVLRLGSIRRFLRVQADISAAGSLQFRSELALWLYYPVSLLESAPVLMPVLIVLAVWCARTMPVTRPLVALMGLLFAVFCVLSTSSGAMGGFRERFLFAFAVGLAPLLGATPVLLGRLRSRRVRVTVACLLAAAAIGAGGYGLAHHPGEWSPPADLLEVTDALRAAAKTRGRPLRVALGPGVERDNVILQVTNGGLVKVVESTGRAGPPEPVHLPEGIDVWIERLPGRVAALPVAAGRVIGRYHLYGPAAPEVPSPAVTLAGWSRRDERGALTPLPPTNPVAIEFADNDPPPGATVAVERMVARGERPRSGSLRIRTVYGHGFYLGRLAAEVSVDRRTLFRRDVAQRGSWETVRFVIPPGTGSSTVSVVVIALPLIEARWEWGRNSTTFVTDFRVDGEPRG